MTKVIKVGFDYWQVLSHYPNEFFTLGMALQSDGVEVVVISAVGRQRAGSVVREAQRVLDIDSRNVHEVLFKHPSESPELKLAKCKELEVTMFFDDRKDVCDLLNANGILAFQVPRKQRGKSDIEAERT